MDKLKPYGFAVHGCIFLQLDIHKNDLPLVMSGITLVVGEVPKTMGAEVEDQYWNW